MAADDGPVIPDPAPGVVLWPMSVVVLRPPKQVAAEGVHDVLVVLCARTRRGDAQMDFTYLGSSAIFSVKPQRAPQLVRVTALTPDRPDLGQVNWGAAATRNEHWLYVYGTRRVGQEFGRELYVGRAPVAKPGDRDRWQFWDGSVWQSRIAQATAILPAHGGVSQTLSVDVIDGRYVAVSKRDGDLGDFVYQWDAPDPTGPWTPAKGVAAPSGYDTGELEYAPLAHPEITLADGNLLVTISRNTTDFERLLEDPEIGRPVFAEVARP
jgi:hypothetical protein